MSQRRSRRSLGLPAAHSDDQQVQFDDFRRRHSKQNREIIHENISRKSLIQSLQDQIAVLQVELLEVRQQNAVLQRSMKAMQDGQERLRDGASVQALDHIIAAMPALTALRKALDTQPPPAVTSSVPFTRTVGNPTATRPAATGQLHITLSTLGEQDEEEQSPRRRNRRQPRDSDETYYPSVSARNTTSPFPSPSPKRTPRKHRRRRESGLLIPRPSTPKNSPGTRSDDAQSPAQFDDAEDHFLDATHVRSRRPTPSPSLLDEDAVEAAVTPTARNVKVRDMAAQLDAVTRETGRMQLVEDKRRSPETALTLSPAPERQESTDETLEGGRTRRARASVSYKEPSLRAKMRKPDGIAVEDLLGTRRLESGVRRKSALPRSTKLPILPFGEAESDEAYDNLPSPTKPETLARPAGPSPRRASASPESEEDRLPPPRYVKSPPNDSSREMKEAKTIPRPIPTSKAGAVKSTSSRRPPSVKRDILREIGSNEPPSDVKREKAGDTVAARKRKPLA